MSMMDLLDTVDLMDGDYKDRFRAEYIQLAIRLERLITMLKRLDRGVLEFEPTCPEDMLWKQAHIMEDYKIILEERAVLEGIDLDI